MRSETSAKVPYGFNLSWEGFPLLAGKSVLINHFYFFEDGSGAPRRLCDFAEVL